MENIELSECIYECIKDTFYNSLFGDFKLVIDKSTGYFNATKLCDAGGKRFHDWARLVKSKNMIEYYQKSWGGETRSSFLYEVKLQNNDRINKQVTGTYVPKELILDIASWISIEFYDRCNSIIINYFIKEFKKMDKTKLKQKIQNIEDEMEKLILENEVKESTIHQQKDKIDQLLDSNQRLEQYVRSLGISIEEVKDQNYGLKKEVEKVQHKLGIAVEDRAPQPEDESKRERFVLIKRNDPEYYPYYTIRAQNSYTIRKLKFEKTNFPNLEVLLDFKCNPNSKTLFNRIKEKLKATGVTFKGNNIDLEESTIDEDKLVEEMKVINESKRDI